MKFIEHNKDKIKLFPSLSRHEPFFQDSTARKVLFSCRRKYFYRVVLGRIPFANNNQLILDWGTAYHKFRELLELKGYKEAMMFAMGIKFPTVDPKSKFAFLDNLRFMKTVQTAYEYQQNEKRLGKIEVIAVEQPFNIEIEPGYFIGGRADQIVKWNNRLWGRDFKTTTKDEGTFSKEIDPNDQATGYIYGESAVHGQKIQGIMFEAMYNAKTIVAKMYTKLVTRFPYQIETWLSELKLNNRLLKIYREEDTWPMDAEPSKCAWCEYHKVCKLSNPMTMENVLRTEYQLKPWDYTHGDSEVLG